jgi:glycosyltransferase involved in cell wall biosynthesis
MRHHAAVPEDADPRIRGRDIVCVGFADWDTDLWTNQHHLMSRLAQENRVLFIESLGLRRPQLAGRDLARMWRRLRRGFAPPRSADGLHVLSPLVIPLHGNAVARRLNAIVLPWLVRRAARRLGMHKPLLWAYVPQAETLVEELAPSTIIYHCVDDIAAHELIDSASFAAAEERFTRRADLVLASAPGLAQRLRAWSANVLYTPNVADTELFAHALEDGPVDAPLARLPAPRIVFTGAIAATKLDFPLLLALARLRPQWSVALVGPVGAGDPRTDVEPLRAAPNIHLLGRRDYAELPSVLRGADAAIIPYARNELTESIFPMKVYEYLAAGLGVVATELPAIEAVADVERVGDAAGMAAALDRVLAGDSPARRRERSQLASGHSWDARIAEIARALEAL